MQPDFDSFFSFAHSKNPSVGFNGVATFARKGLTIKANGRPFGLGWLDDQGRIIETDHDSFVLLNVYAPNEGPFAAKLGEKMAFLMHLKQRISQLEASGRSVVLVGDLNLRMRLEDLSVDARSLHLPSLVSFPVQQVEPPIVQRIRSVLRGDGFERFCEALFKMEARVFKNDRYRVFLRNVDSDVETRVNVEGLWSKGQVDGAYSQFKLEQTTVPVCANDPTDLDDWPGVVTDGNGNLAWISHAENYIRIGELCRAIPAVFGGNEVTSEELSMLARFCQVHNLLMTSSRPSVAHFAKSLPLVDVFAKCFPNHKSRWTIFTQSTNERYTNAGDKIDYVLISNNLQAHVVPPTTALQGCACQAGQCPTDGSCSCDDLSALRAATANGLWKPAPFEGGGIPEAPTAAYQHQFRTPPASTGIIYTPPSFSDHLAVTCLFDFARDSKLLTLSSDAATKACRPHARQRSILDMFKRAAPSISGDAIGDSVGDAAAMVTGATPTAGTVGQLEEESSVRRKKPKTTILDHFKGNS